MSTRDELHQLINQLGEDRLADAGALLRDLNQRGVVRRQFRFDAGMRADADLSQRSEQVLRDELGRDR